MVYLELAFKIFDSTLSILVTLLYAYQAFYIAYILFKKIFKINKDETADAPSKLHKYGIVVCARNEEPVIGELIESLKAQDYPEELLKIMVIADNCTDCTANISESMGATVFVRNDKEHIGKGFALDAFFKKLLADNDDCDAYMIFDADNLVDKNFVKEMNKVFCKGYEVITSYRNSKNFEDNWISSGYSLWFIREAAYLNKPRYELKTTCAISGTGFCVSRKIIEEQNGWGYFTLTEDLELSVNRAISKKLIGFSEKSVLYDEQPTSFKHSWNQRMRWGKGGYQILAKDGGRLIKSIFKGNFSAYDLLAAITPIGLYSLYGFIKGIVQSIIAIFNFNTAPNVFTGIFNCVMPIINSVLIFYILFFLAATITVITEHKKIHATKLQLIKAIFTFPWFVLVYSPVALITLFKKVQWTPIPHTVKKSIKELEDEVNPQK